jgi:putative ABC transport system ATP-binding protein
LTVEFARADFHLNTGELAVLLGPSGIVKWNPLNILGGLDTPPAGRVGCARRDPNAAGDRELTRYRRLDIGFVFHFYNLIPSLGVRDKVAIVTEIAPRPHDPAGGLGPDGLGSGGGITCRPSFPDRSQS